MAASLLKDGLQVFLDQNRGYEEEKVPWPIWMQDKIEAADYVLLVCTELYWKKVRGKVAEDEGQGVCWEANIIYTLLYESKLNTSKFVPILFSASDERFIPTPLRGRNRFVVDSHSGYERLYAFLTQQPRVVLRRSVLITATKTNGGTMSSTCTSNGTWATALSSVGQTNRMPPVRNGLKRSSPC